MATKKRDIPDDCTIRTMDMPVAAGGFISESPDGHINIYINARLSRDGQLRALAHELVHYDNDDLNNDDDIQTVERRAEGAAHTLPPLVLARDIPRPTPRTHTKQIPFQIQPADDWAHDVIHDMPYLD